MSIEEDAKTKISRDEVESAIREKGYFTLASGTPVEVRILSGKSTITPTLNANGFPTETGTIENNSHEEKRSSVVLKQDTMIGRITFYSGVSDILGMSTTSPSLINSQRELQDWEAGLAKEYQVSDEYIDSEHEEQYTGDVDLTLFAHANPEVGKPLLEKQRVLTEERNRLQKEADVAFLQSIGETVGEDFVKADIYVNVDQE